MDLVFNELSLFKPLDSLDEARKRMASFVEILQHSFRHGLSKDLRVTDDFLHMLLAKDYRIVQWLNDGEVDKELKSFFKARISRKPYIDVHTESHLYNHFARSEFIYEGFNSKGLGIAYLLDGVGISIFSHEQWNTHSVEASFIELDSQGEIYEEKIQIRHISTPSHFEFHKLYYEQRKWLDIGGLDWRNSLQELFPSLVFCERAIAQLHEYGKGEHILKQIKSRLIELQEYFNTWSEGRFDSSLVSFKVSPESQRTLEQYVEEHTFLCPDGQYRIFSWHLRMTPGAGRIFFIPDEITRKCIIGHIGNKLKTVNDPT